MRNKCIPMILVACMGLYLNTAKAEGLKWTGVQINLPISGELDLGKGVGVRGHVSGFFVPENGTKLGFFYAGPTFVPIDTENFSLWLSPQLGTYLNWWEGTDAFGPSLWANVSLLGGKMSVFLEGEVIFAVREENKVFYGYYALDGHPLEWLNFGGQVEQVDKNLIWGPHVGVSKGPLHLELQYYFGVDMHTIRVVAGLGF